MNTLASERVRAVLDRLFTAAAIDSESHVDRPLAEMSSQERADALATQYMPISEPGGKLLYGLIRCARPSTVIEFGTSFAISTIYLAAAVADSGAGHVYTTELNLAKVETARANLVEAGLGDHVTVLPGDALETLAGIPGPIGIVLLDGWKDLYVPVLKSLEDRLAPGALVVADDSTFPSMAGYLAYIRDPANGYVSVDFPVEDGMEISCRA
jgi:predicted O-methyltransferase YrrM